VQADVSEAGRVLVVDRLLHKILGNRNRRSFNAFSLLFRVYILTFLEENFFSSLDEEDILFLSEGEVFDCVSVCVCVCVILILT